MTKTLLSPFQPEETPAMPPIKKIVTWIVVIFLLYAILTSPQNAADIFRNIWDIIYGGIRNIFEFFNSLLTSG